MVYIEDLLRPKEGEKLTIEKVTQGHIVAGSKENKRLCTIFPHATLKVIDNKEYYIVVECDVGFVQPKTVRRGSRVKVIVKKLDLWKAMPASEKKRFRTDKKESPLN